MMEWKYVQKLEPLTTMQWSFLLLIVFSIHDL